jgi:hypothetical protein
MFSRFVANRNRVSHLIQGLLDVNERILLYGDKTHQKPEQELQDSSWLKLKTWFGSVPKQEQTHLTDDWSLFVKHKGLVGTIRENLIDPRFTSAYTDTRSLLQLAVDLEAQHGEHHAFDATPPIYLTVSFSGIVDEPADGDEIHHVCMMHS